MAQQGFTTELRDGARVLVRPLEAGDVELLREGLSRLSDRSRYLRFLHHVADIPEADLQRIADVDPVNRMAWGALDLTGEQPSPVGIARYIRSSEIPDLAEVAVTVIDSHQGLGLGTVLLAALTTSAALNGITRFEATVHPENHAMNLLFDELGSTHSGSTTDTVRHLIPIHSDAELYPHTPTGDAYRRIYALIRAAA